jgi:hypothetical protein
LTPTELRARYLALINDQLPAAAKSRRWPVRLNHCFARIVLDNLFGGCWYDHLSRKAPAYKQLSAEQLEQAITIAENILRRQDVYCSVLNENSLRWRGKLGDG